MQDRFFIQFPMTYASTQDEWRTTFEQDRPLRRQDLHEAAEMLVTDPIVTCDCFSVRMGYSGLLLIDCKWSTYMACRRMLIHWGFIDG